jgi:hypothetical protein
MLASQKGVTEVTQYIRSMSGSSQSILVKASDGLNYVAKFTNNLQGPNLSFNESAGSDLYRVCGLSVPSWKPLLITDHFLDRNPDCWMQTSEGRLRPATGLCYGSQFLGADGLRLVQILPEVMFKRIRNRASFWVAWMIDICAEHADDRQAVFQQDAKGWWKAFFIDHGHLFGGPRGATRSTPQESLSLDPRIYPDMATKLIQDALHFDRTLNVDRLWRKVQSMPEDWKTKSALDSFARCLCRLSSPSILKDIFDEMIDGLNKRRNFGHSLGEDIRKPVLQSDSAEAQVESSPLRAV